MAVPHPSGDFLTSKAGPMPVWAWFAAGLAAALGYAYYREKKNGLLAGANAANGTPGYTLPSNIQPQQTTVNENDQAYNIGSNNSQYYNNSRTANNLTTQTSTTLNQNGSGNSAAVTASTQPPAAGSIGPAGPPQNTPPPPPASSVPPPSQVPATVAWHRAGGGVRQPQTYGYASTGAQQATAQSQQQGQQGQHNGGGGYGPGGQRSGSYGGR